MNLVKSEDFFSPAQVKERIHIIGCGSVGGCIAELLVRFGITKITLYDFDTVEDKNVVNQIYDYRHVGMPKVEALAQILRDINPMIGDDLKIEPEGYTNQRLSGYVFLAADSMTVRQEVVKRHRANPNVSAMFDIRTELTRAQHYAANWSRPDDIRDLLTSMDFTDEEAKDSTPVSACGVVLGVAPTVRMVVNVAVVNFINFIKSDKTELKRWAYVDAFGMSIDAF